MRRVDKDKSRRQRISALVDSEISGTDEIQAWEDIASDKELLRAWESYRIIGNSLRRGQRAAEPCLSFSGENPVERRQPFSRDAETSRASPHYKKAIVKSRVALAASILVLLAAVPVIHLTLSDSQSGIEVVSPERGRAAGEQSVTRWRRSDATRLTHAELTALVVQHGEFGSLVALNGLTSYARFVSDDVTP